MDDSSVLTIISGGQTGVDRGALDAALHMGLPCGGLCPRGRRAEDGVIPEHYPLRETTSRGYRERTIGNLTQADATLILHAGAIDGGTGLTVSSCRKLHRERADRGGYPYLVVGLESSDARFRISDWLRRHPIRVLNVAGPRESKEPGIQDQTRKLLEGVLRETVLKA